MEYEGEYIAVLTEEYLERKTRGEKFSVETIPLIDIFIMFIIESTSNNTLARLLDINPRKLTSWRLEHGINAFESPANFINKHNREFYTRMKEKNIDTTGTLGYCFDWSKFNLDRV